MMKLSTTRKILTGVGWVAFFGLPLWVGAYWDPFDGTVTRKSHYKVGLRQFPGKAVRHFPPQIPEGESWYYYSPGPLQADPQIELLVMPSTSRIDQLYDQLNKTAKEHYIGFDANRVDDSEIEMRGGHFMRVFLTNDIEQTTPNADDHYFTTFIGDGIEATKSGVCINKKLGTVVYYCHLGRGERFPADTAH